MGKNYYLSKGNLKEKFDKIRLTEIFKDMNSLEAIDVYTSGFANLEELRKELIKDGLIRSTDDICIGTYKTVNGVKRLIPIYNRTLIFKSDLEKLNINGKTYESIALELKKYIQNRFNDMDFMSYIIDNYYEKYVSSKRNVKAPIYESGDVSILHRIINSSEKTNRDEREYALSFKNFINNELYKCEMVFEDVVFTENDKETVKMFKPIDNKVNVKGLHDLLCHIINYSMSDNFEYKNVDRYEARYEQTTLETYENEEFLESRDFQRPLIDYAKEVGLDLTDKDAIEKDDYANSFILDEQRLVKNLGGME